MHIETAHSLEEIRRFEKQGYKVRSISYFLSNPVMTIIMGKAEA